MNRWSYCELAQYIYEDFNEFLSDGLNVRQVISRIQVEYYKIMEESPIERLMIYILLAKLEIEHGFLREDIREEVLRMINDNRLSKFSNELETSELKKLKEDIDELLIKLS
jgi:uncharacterized membrane protein YheB (UPF0754 family)